MRYATIGMQINHEVHDFGGFSLLKDTYAEHRAEPWPLAARHHRVL